MVDLLLKYPAIFETWNQSHQTISCLAVHRQTFHPSFFWIRQLLSPAVGSKHNRFPDQFWNRFLKEYMPTILKRGKWSTPTQNLQPGDLVWVLEDFYATWVLKTTFGYIHRPVVKLSKFPVEIVNKLETSP